MKHYAKRDHMAQDAAGNYYSRHVSAMTAEALHAKSEIAGELAHRDMEIDRLRAELKKWSEFAEREFAHFPPTRDQGANTGINARPEAHEEATR